MIAVAAHPRVMVAFTRDRSVLARALEALEPSDAPTRLSLGIQLAHSAAAGRGPLEIDVFTDLSGETVGFSPSAGERLRFFRFGRTDDNVALAALRVYQNPFQDAGEARGYALVKNYAHQPKDLALHVTLASKPVLDETLHLAGSGIPRRAHPHACRRGPPRGMARRRRCARRRQSRARLRSAGETDSRARGERQRGSPLRPERVGTRGARHRPAPRRAERISRRRLAARRSGDLSRLRACRADDREQPLSVSSGDQRLVSIGSGRRRAHRSSIGTRPIRSCTICVTSRLCRSIERGLLALPALGTHADRVARRRPGLPLGIRGRNGRPPHRLLRVRSRRAVAGEERESEPAPVVC